MKHTQRSNCKKQTNRRDRKAARQAYRKHVKMLRKYVQDIKKRSKCAICGDSRWYVLDFHHTTNKAFNISQQIRRNCSFEYLKKEISKCIILCANCHRELHYMDSQYRENEA